MPNDRVARKPLRAPGNHTESPGRRRLYAWAAFGLALGTLLPPLAADARAAAKIPRIGLIRPGSLPDPFAEAFIGGLRDLGYVEGRTIIIESRWAAGKPERYPDLTADLIRLKMNVLFTTTDPGIRAAQQATSTIPILMLSTDPVGSALVASLARPGGNITGFSTMSPELNAKRMELLKLAFPMISRVTVLRGARQAPTDLRAAEAAARTLGLRLETLEVRDIHDLETALAAAKKGSTDALNILPSGFFSAHCARIVQAVARARLPAIYEHGDFVAVGGLMSYAPHFPDLFRRAATVVDKILKGGKPGDLPVEQPTRFELVINLKTARALGLAIPQSLIVRADQVIP